MFLKLVVCMALPFASLAARAAEASQRDLHFSLGSFYGVPKLDVFYTSEVDEAAAFLEEWSSEREFGLYVRVVHSDNKAFFPVRVVLLAICRGTRVLVFDLKPLLREVPRPLPAPIASFLEDRNRTFFGMDLKRSCGRVAFEFDTVIRCVDYNIRAWPELRLGGGLYGVFNRFVSLDVDLWRPDNLESLSSQARHAYLQWSVSHYFTTFYGSAPEDWIISRSELFEAGPVYLRVAQPKHDWVKAREEWMQRKQERAAMSILRTLQLWRNRERSSTELSDEETAAAPAPEEEAARGAVRAARLDGAPAARVRVEARAE